MNVKAIMCDIDGTLLSSEGVVTKKTVEMIKKSREKGILFGLSTGRDVNSIQTLLGTWGIEGLVDMIERKFMIIRLIFLKLNIH